MNYYTVTYKDREGVVRERTFQAPTSLIARLRMQKQDFEVFEVYPAAPLEDRLSKYIDTLEDIIENTDGTDEILVNVIKDLKRLLGNM